MDMNLAFEILGRDPRALDDIAGSIASGEKMWEVSRRYGVSQGQLGYWLASDSDRALRYAAALKAASHSVLVEGLERVREGFSIDDGRDGWEGRELDERKVIGDGRRKGAKLLLEYAGVMNPERYGRSGEMGGMVVGALTQVLREISERKMRERIAPVVERDVTPINADEVAIETTDEGVL